MTTVSGWEEGIEGEVKRALPAKMTKGDRSNRRRSEV